MSLFRLLNSMARIFTKFPTSEAALETSLRTLPLCESSLPASAPPIMIQVMMSAMEAFSKFDFNENLSIVNQALKFVVTLWTKYPSSLPPASNMKHLAHLVVAALEPELNGSSRSKDAIANAAEFVSCIMRSLSDSQVVALEKEGVFRRLRHLMIFYDEMSSDELRQIIVGLGIFAELFQSPMDFIDDNSYVGLLQSILMHPSDEAIQTLTWQLLSVLCNSEPHFAKSLFEAGLLRTMLSLLQSDNVFPLPVIRFMVRYFYIFKGSALKSRELVSCLMGMLKGNGKDNEGDELFAKLCELLSMLCGCGMANLSTVFELNVVQRLLDCARACPNEQFLLFACIALEGVSNSLPSSGPIPSLSDPVKAIRTEYSNQNYHEFIREMLSEPQVSSNMRLVKTLYITFQKVLRPLAQEHLKEKVHTREYIDFFLVCFIRDTAVFKSLTARIVFTTHFFVFEMKSKEPISILKDLNFHVSVATLLNDCSSSETISTAMGLLACMVGKYYEYLKVVKPFVEAKVPNILLEKAKLLGTHSQFSDDFGRIMLNLTADKELSLELFEDGYLEKLLEVFGNKSMLGIRRSVIHAIGNIALGGQHVKQVLLDKHFYVSLFSILRLEMHSADPFLISACCRVLHILASGDWVKRKFVESGCIELLLKIMRTRQDNSEVQWRPLGLLSSLGFMAVINRRFILTNEILEVVATILRKSKNGKVISYTTLVFLGSDELDSGARKLREIGVVEALQAAINSPNYRKQAPDLERWGIHVLEKQNLYTLSLPRNSEVTCPPPCPENHSSDWPPYIMKESSVDTDSAASSAAPPDSILLPLDEVYFKSNTPIAPELTDLARAQLASLGLNPDKPLFRIGRLYGSTHGLCSNCDKENPSEELVIRPLSMTVDQYQLLVDCGWYRRGGVKMFRLRHNHNMECCDWETRVLVKKFDHTKHKSYKKVLKRMPVKRLTVETCHAHFSKEAFDLYNEYHVKKHDKPLKSEYSYCEHVVNTPTTYQVIDGIEYGTFHQLYRLDGKLVAVGIIDVIPRGMVSIYMWYDVNKETAKYSFGVYSALKEIEMVISMSEKNPKMEYYYLQGWNNNNKKLSYKANYEPEEFYCPCIVADWVPALDGVEQSKKEVIEKEALKAAEEEQTDGDGTVTEPPQKGMNGESALKVTPGNSNENESNSVPVKHVKTRAFPLDMKRYEEVTGKELDISKIVICLNYTEFLYLEDLFMRYVKDDDQREIMESRFRELYICLCPELWSQLVIDMMVSGTSPGS